MTRRTSSETTAITNGEVRTYIGTLRLSTPHCAGCDAPAGPEFITGELVAFLTVHALEGTDGQHYKVGVCKGCVGRLKFEAFKRKLGARVTKQPARYLVRD